MSDDSEIVVSDDDDRACVPSLGKRKAHTAAANRLAKRARPAHDCSAPKHDAAASLSAPTADLPPRIADASRPDNAHQRFWYSDGTLVIEVDGILFNVYRGRMMGQSAYLAERLRNEPDSGTKAQPLHLDNTTADDIAELLELLETSLPTRDTTKRAPALAAIVRAANTLRCREHRDWAVHRISELWPAGRHKKRRARPTTEEALECILLFQATKYKYDSGEDVVLPRAYYQLIVAGPNAWAQKLQIRRPSATTHRMKTSLPAEIQLALYTARDELRAIWLACVQEGMRMDCAYGSGTCGGVKTMARKKAAWFDHVTAVGAGTDDPEDGIAVLCNTNWQKHGWCSKCVARNKKVWCAKLPMIRDKMDELARL